MTTWKKVMGGGTWPIYFERDGLTAEFGRFCIQPLQKSISAHVANHFRKALIDALVGPAVIGMHFRLHREQGSHPVREKELLSQARGWLKNLRIVTPGRFPLTGRVKKTGPGRVLTENLYFDAPVQIVTSSSRMIELMPGETLELNFIFQWGKGDISANQGIDVDLPRGWIALDRSHSPVRRCDLNSTSIEIGPHRGFDQLILEITTDGTISPEDALRRAGNHVRLPTHPLTG